MASCTEILSGLVAVLIVLYYYFTSNFNFWKSRGVNGPKPVPIFGNMMSVTLRKEFVGCFTKKIYDIYKGEPMVGLFARTTPILLLKDPDLIKDVLIKDFSKFGDRGLPVYEKVDPMTQNLFNLEWKRWRPVRSRLSPVFTSGKIKEMLSLIVECANHLEEYMNELIKKGEPIECRDLMAKYTTDVIGSCAFGIEMNSLSNKESEFRKIGKRIFTMTTSKLLKTRIRQSMPWLYKIVGRIWAPDASAIFFMNIIREAIEYRQKNNIVRHDFVDILAELKKHPEKLGDIECTDALLTAQAFAFFAAGFETSSTFLSNTLYELAQNHEIQDKLREEIKEAYEKCKGELQYENINEMKYLHKVFEESLRKYPPGTIIIRQSHTPYTFEGTKVTIPNKQFVWIPIYAIHHDADLYPNPEVFDPERFSKEAIEKRHPMNFLPFGDGPRNCIGARFAIYQTKIGLIKVLRNFKVDVCEKTDIPYEIDPVSIVLAPKRGIYLKITRVAED